MPTATGETRRSTTARKSSSSCARAGRAPPERSTIDRSTNENRPTTETETSTESDRETTAGDGSNGGDGEGDDDPAGYVPRGDEWDEARRRAAADESASDDGIEREHQHQQHRADGAGDGDGETESEAGPKPVLWVGCTSHGRLDTEASLRGIGQRIRKEVGDEFHVIVADDKVRLADTDDLAQLSERVERLHTELRDVRAELDAERRERETESTVERETVERDDRDGERESTGEFGDYSAGDAF